MSIERAVKGVMALRVVSQAVPKGISGYTSEYFDRLDRGAMSSARVIAPLVLDLVEPGPWSMSAVAQEHG